MHSDLRIRHSRPRPRSRTFRICLHLSKPVAHSRSILLQKPVLPAPSSVSPLHPSMLAQLPATDPIPCSPLPVAYTSLLPYKTARRVLRHPSPGRIGRRVQADSQRPACKSVRCAPRRRCRSCKSERRVVGRAPFPAQERAPNPMATTRSSGLRRRSRRDASLNSPGPRRQGSSDDV